MQPLIDPHLFFHWCLFKIGRCRMGGGRMRKTLPVLAY